jgi:gliding motility-associated-like protein
MISAKRHILFLCFFVSIACFSVSRAQGDDCLTALQLNNVSNYCSGAAFYTNIGSTPGTWGNPTCFGATNTEDVWFQFTATGTDALISVGGSGNGGTMLNPAVAIYNGDCATTVNEQGCNAAAGSGIVQLYEGAMIPGSVYYIRVSTTAANEGTFELCLNNYTPSANPGADCGGAAFLCNQSPVSVGTLSGGGLNNDEPEASTCLENGFGADEGNSSWFYWTCGTAGTFTLDITPLNPMDDIDFIVYQLNTTNPCGPRTVLRCNSSSCLNANGSTGLSLTDVSIVEDPNCDPGENAYCQFINMTAGTTYALLVNNFSANMGFTVNFGGTGTFQGPNPNITAAPVSICPGGTVIFNGSTSTNIAGGLNWNFSNGGSQASATGAGPHSITYTNPGTYTAILNGTDFAGCTATESVIITVNAGPPAPAVSNLTYCQGATATALTATGTNLLWYTTPTGGVGSASAPTPSTTTPGTVSYYVSQTTNGCESPLAQIDVIVTPQTTMDVPMALEVCAGESIPPTNFTSSTAGTTYTWTNTNTSIGLAASGNGSLPGFTAVNNGTVDQIATLALTPSVGTCVGATVSTTITVHPLPSVSAGADQALCAGESTSANAAGALTYTWNNGITDGSTFTPGATTTYTVTGTSADGCVSTDQMQVVVNPIPTVSAGNDITICPGVSITLTGSGASTYSWDNGVVDGVPFIPASGTVTYTVTGTTTDGCENSDAMNVLLTPLDPVTFAPDITLGCSPLVVNFSNTTANALDCVWSFGDGTTQNSCGTVTNTFEDYGCYAISLTVTFANGCVNTLTQPNLVCVEAPPMASFIAVPAVINQYDSQTSFLNTTIGAVSYVWNFDDGSPTTTDVNPSHDYSGMPLGNYEVMLIATSPSGCIDTTTSIIQIKEDLLFYIPNCFTPDEDEHNQFFQPIFTSGFDPFDFNLFIYNRWGQLIFESHDATIGWDGSYGVNTEVSVVQDGIYTWKIEFKTSDTDERKVVVGHVNVIR